MNKINELAPTAMAIKRPKLC